MRFSFGQLVFFGLLFSLLFYPDFSKKLFKTFQNFLFKSR